MAICSGMDEVGIHPAVQVVQAYFSARQADGYEAARSYWADDAVWHITGGHDGAGDYSPDGYLGNHGHRARILTYGRGVLVQVALRHRTNVRFDVKHPAAGD
jgi:ketosteroid isomerase-like protein